MATLDGTFGNVPEFPPNDGNVVTDGTNILVLDTNLAGRWELRQSDPFESDLLIPPSSLSGEREIVAFNTFQQRLTVLNNFLPIGSIADPALQYRYVSYGMWSGRVSGVEYPFRREALIFGYPTLVTDLPGAGQQNFTAIVRGLLTSVTGGPPAAYTDDDVSGTVTLTRQGSNISASLTLTYTRSGATQVIGTFTGPAAVSAQTRRFSGNLTSTDSALTGPFAGQLYGPQGAEIGIVFALNGALGSGATRTEQRVAGAVLGK